MSVFFPARGELLGGVYNPYLWIPIGLATYTGYKLTSWYSYYKALPDNASIESWPWYKKVAVGWMAKGEGFVDAIGAAFNNWKKEQEEKAKLFNKLDSLGKLKFSLTEAFNTAIAPIKAAADFVVGTYNYFKREWERDKWDFAWKLAGIVAGVVATIAGIAAAPVTGGGSLILTAAGITMIASGIAVGAKESYEYTEAKTKKELDRDAKDDLDEIVFVPSMGIAGTLDIYNGIEMYSINRGIQNTPMKWKDAYLEGHGFPKHGKPMGLTLEEYRDQSLSLFQRARGDAFDRQNLVIGSYVKGGVKYGVYDQDTNWFLPVEDKEGIVTYFPVESSNPKSYIFRQPSFYSLSPVHHPEIAGTSLLAVGSSAAGDLNRTTVNHHEKR